MHHLGVTMGPSKLPLTWTAATSHSTCTDKVFDEPRRLLVVVVVAAADADVDAVDVVFDLILFVAHLLKVLLTNFDIE